jgi:hypothetical protein
MLEGTIGGPSVHMSLTISDGKVTGSYYYDKVGKETEAGGVNRSGPDDLMDEYDENGAMTGSFDGWYTRGIRITGTWTNAKTEENTGVQPQGHRRRSGKCRLGRRMAAYGYGHV